MARIAERWAILFVVCTCSLLRLPAQIIGVWSGTTAENRSVSFKVFGGAVRGFSYSYPIQGPGCSSSVSASVSGVPISGNSFAIQLGDLNLTGSFTSSTTASGSLADKFSSGSCSGQLATTWTATRTPEPAPDPPYVQQGPKLVASDVTKSSSLGQSVSISGDGNTAVAGAWNDRDSAGTPGASVIFTRTNGVWGQQGSKLVGTGASPNSTQGRRVAISGDGNTVIVGGQKESSSANVVWIFTRTNGVWTQQGSFAGTAGSSSLSASSVGISDDGNTAVVGYNNNSPYLTAWVYTRTNGVWSQPGSKLFEATGVAGSGFASLSVAISGDGNTAIVGNPNDDAPSDVFGAPPGAARIFTRTNGVWSQQGKLYPTTSSGRSPQFCIGHSVAISGNWNTVIVAGTSYTWIFTRTNGVWSQPTDLDYLNDVTDAVGISGDGNTVITGWGTAFAGYWGSSNGVAYTYKMPAGGWKNKHAEGYQGKLVGTGAHGPPMQGTSVALSLNGSTAIIGGPFDLDGGAAWVFYAAPPAIPPPSPTSLTPAVSSGANQTLTATFNAPGGYQTLDVVNVLINTALDGRQACYLAYSQTSNALYIVADNGDSTQISGKVMDGAGTVANSQCAVALAGSSATGTGNTLTLVLNLSFPASFAGNKVVYTAARDISQNNSGWQTMGTHSVPPPLSTFPNPVSMSPSSGNALSQTIAFTYQDQSTAANLQTVWALINTAIDGRAACYVAYYRPGNQVYLYPDNGDGSQATNIVLTGSNTIGNSQCTISAQGASVQTSGNTLTVTLPIAFKPAFAGFKGVWLAAQTMGGAQTSPWQALGAEVVPGQ